MKILSFIKITVIVSGALAPAILPGPCWAVTPTILASNAGSPENLIVDNSTVYWGDSLTGQISSVSKNPGGAVTHYSTHAALGGDIVQDNASLYFIGAAHAGNFVDEHSIYKMSKTGGLATAIGNQYAYGGSLAIGPAGGVLYYNGGARDIVTGTGSLTRVIASLSTLGGNEQVLIWDGLGVEAELQAAHRPYWLGSIFDHPSTDSAFLYWLDPTSIWQMPLVGGAASTVVSGRTGIRFIATPTTGAAAGSIFWIEGSNDNYSLKRRKVGGQIITVLSNITSSYRCFAVDNEKVFSEQTGDVVQVSIDGGAVTVLSSIKEVFGPTALALDANYIYCGNLLGQIVRIPRSSVVPTSMARGDFNADSFTDYLLFNSATHRTAIWNLQGNALLAGLYGPTLPAGWVVRCVADLNRDGKPDYVLFNASTRRTAIWFLNGNALLGSAYGPTLPAGWTLIAAADINSDGRPDYVLFNASTRQTRILFLNGTASTSAASGPTLPAGWILVDALDFNRDGKPDFLLSNSSAQRTAIWYLNGVAHTASANGPTLPAGWVLQGAADFNSDRKPDYVLSNTSTRRTAIWYLNGATLAGSGYGPAVPAGYSLVFP